MAKTATTDTEAQVQTGQASLVKWVFWPTAVIVVGLSAVTIIWPTLMQAAFESITSWITSNFGWWYVFLAFAFVVFCVALGLSKKGDIKLGRPDDEPEFSLMSWFALLFAAGMGIGLVFFGVTEPMSHFVEPRPGEDVSGVISDSTEHGGEVATTTAKRAQSAMATTFLHWGFQPWAIYVIVGLSLALAIHRRGRPLSVRWGLEPLFGEKRVKGTFGNVIDVIALVGTVFGVSTSLGLGVNQITAGMAHMGWVDESNPWIKYVLIAVVTACVLWSVLTGVSKGMKWLSNTNLVLAGGLVLFLLIVGPTQFLLKEFVQSIGYYLQNYLGLSMNTSAFQGEAGEAWQAGWSTFYWGWWIAWSPFVGVFIARISRGRTVREFILGVMGVPATITFLWFAVLGGNAIYREIHKTPGYESIIGSDGGVDSNAALFQMLAQIPGSAVLIVGAMLLSAIFFITSSDSGSLVMAMLATGGDSEPRSWIRAFFAVATSVLAAALLMAGGLEALQAASISVALPFSFVMVLLAIATWKYLGANVRRNDKLRREAFIEEIGEAYGLETEETESTTKKSDSWWRGLRK
ncbi:BCCT family transporter [Pseudoglutamicibacter cumminsii]|uniref:BCCT family transporter n=1 Tax=Pseudoglutamicibacter cumminsii TaxID=156979 RepID=A0AAP4C7N7_9MICC|nr:BCCT family transporter [Pseudoglutamicibacter cumminsii]MDK6275387.1 BCCT family transporter [Pseudoglutamicibacter cumminsii]